MEYAIDVRNVSKIYKLYATPKARVRELFSPTRRSFHQDFVALSDISFQVERGETIAIIGKNGAGKSTLLKLITGVSAPTSGTIKVNGKVSALLELGTGFNPELDGYENIYLNGTMHGYTKAEVDEKLEEILAFADIGEYIAQPVKSYSSGMFARLAFAVMISFRPEILIVDEALSVGDIFFQQKCNVYMKEKMKGVTKLLVTHDMNSVANMADRVILMDQGRILKMGSPLETIEEYLKLMHTDVFSGGRNAEQAAGEAAPSAGGADWKPVTVDETGGALEVRIKEYMLLINGTDADIAKPDDEIEIRIRIHSQKQCGNIILGYTFKDKYGNSIFAQSTLGAGHRITDVGEGDYILSVRFPWPQVKEGDYFLTLGIGEGDDQLFHTIQCWAHNIAHVQGIATVPMHGIINHTIDSLTVEEVHYDE